VDGSADELASQWSDFIVQELKHTYTLTNFHELAYCPYSFILAIGFPQSDRPAMRIAHLP